MVLFCLIISYSKEFETVAPKNIAKHLIGGFSSRLRNNVLNDPPFLVSVIWRYTVKSQKYE